MKKSFLENLKSIYKKDLKKKDKLGYSDKFKKATEAFIEQINEEQDIKDNLKDNPLHAKDLCFQDGYYMNAHGSNSIVSFHIDECPGWLFGIWWDFPDVNDKRNCIDGTFFAQYEECINKFKPSESSMRCSISAFFNEKIFIDLYKATKIICFIKNEPYLAFCRHYCGWNYNLDYHTRSEARRKYESYRSWKDRETKYTKEFDDKIVDFVKARVLPNFKDAELEDYGENYSPRYEVVAPFKKNKDLVDKPGCYAWFSDDDKEGVQIMKEFAKIIDECDKIADKYLFIWYSPIDNTVIFI